MSLGIKYRKLWTGESNQRRGESNQWIAIEEERLSMKKIIGIFEQVRRVYKERFWESTKWKIKGNLSTDGMNFVKSWRICKKRKVIYKVVKAPEFKGEMKVFTDCYPRSLSKLTREENVWSDEGDTWRTLKMTL